MPDFAASKPEPRNWSEAFAALPLESPPGDAWAKIAAGLPAAPAKRHRRPLWLAFAAAVALAVALPMLPTPRDEKAPPPVAVRPARQAPRAVPAPTPADAAGRTPRPAAIASTATQPAPGPARAGPPKRTSSESELAALYARSARLEALLAQMQDDRFATGPAAAMTGELESRIAFIDASLSEPSLAPPQRAALWRQRVDALQQLAGFQGAQRLLAAQGERYDGRMVAVY